MNLADMLELLRLHTTACHSNNTPTGTPARQRQAERVKRPMLTLTGKALEQEEFEHFMYLFDQFKSRLEDDQDGAALLRECLGPDISRILYSNFGAALSTFTEEDIKTNIAKHCVTQQTTQARATELHRLKQEPGQNVATFLATLKSKARQCDLKTRCKNCQAENDFSEKVTLTLFLTGLQDSDLQQDLLAEQDLDLEKALRIATARETAKRSQCTINTTSQAVEGISAYKADLKRIRIPRDCCTGCGKKKHTDRSTCPAKDSTCSCGRTGHFQHLCFNKGKPREPKKPKIKEQIEKETTDETGHYISETCFNINDEVLDMDIPEEATINSLVFEEATKTWKNKPCDESSNQLHVIIKPQTHYWKSLHPHPNTIPAKNVTKATKSTGIADTGASVTCAGKNIMRRMGLEEKHLIPTTTIIRVASQAKLTVLGMIPVSVQVAGYPSKHAIQALYITQELNSLFLSRSCLLELGCIPQSWPYPQEEDRCSANTTEPLAPCGCRIRQTTPDPPSTLPYPATDENANLLKEWLLDYYGSSTFNNCTHQQLPEVSGPPVKLAIKPRASFPCHIKPYRVPLHWKKEVEDGLQRDLNMGIIEKVPANTPAICCHRMVVTSKPGSPKPRRTVDMSALKEASYRLTHPGAPPFLEAQSVPENSYKTVTDAWQGFHMIPVHPESQPYTTFVTEQGMFRYKRMPMGDHASMDAYNYRFDKVTEKVKNLKRCVDDSLLHAKSLEEAFYQTADYLSLVGKNGILQNPEKFQFGSKTAEWAGFILTETSVKPLDKHTAAIRNFPRPANITDLRSFMALIQQVAYCYATSPTTAPLRHLLKPSEPWNWSEETDSIFLAAREVIAEKVDEGVRLFNPNLPTGLLSDWCEEGMGHILCQKHCSCPKSNDLNCCIDGWKVCSVGSRFCNKAESNYSPTDGEFTAVVEALEKTAYFTLGCSDLTIGTDHKPLISIINDTNLGEIKTPRQQRLKERLMRWRLTATYIPGKLLGGTDALSRYGIRKHNDDTLYYNSSLAAVTENRESCQIIISEHEETLLAINNSFPPVTRADMVLGTDKDKTLLQVRHLIRNGFPDTKTELTPGTQSYWKVRELLTEHEGIIYMGERVVVPATLRDRVLSTLHSAHQGTTSMRLRAEKQMYWPNMAADIAATRNACTTCDAVFPSQSSEPPITPIQPQYPFQHICSDYFSVAGHNFCLVVDRFSNWLQVHTGKGGAGNLIKLLGESFHSFGIPESLTSDQGVEYTAAETQEFLKKLGIHHRKSSVGFPHANQKAERSVGKAKRLIRDSVKISGELDTVNLIKGLLQLRNTPDPDTGLSPAQTLLGRQLRDFIPAKPAAHIKSHKDLSDVWKSVADWRELALAPRSAKLHDRLVQQTKELPPLQEGDCVLIQNMLGNHPKRWDKRGIVIQADPKHRQYKVMTFGSRRMTIRNRRHLRKFIPVHTPVMLPTGIKPSSQTKESTVEPTPRKVSPTEVVKEYELPPYDEGRPQDQHQDHPEPTVQVQHSQQTQLQHQPEQDRDQPQLHEEPLGIQPQQPSQWTAGQTPPAHVMEPQSPQYQREQNITNTQEPRRSSRTNKGQTARYEDYVQNFDSYQCPPNYAGFNLLNQLAYYPYLPYPTHQTIHYMPAVQMGPGTPNQLMPTNMIMTLPMK